MAWMQTYPLIKEIWQLPHQSGAGNSHIPLLHAYHSRVGFGLAEQIVTIMPRRPRVLLGVSGSVAAIKVPLIADLLARFAEVQIITTDAARKLIPPEFLAATAISIRGAMIV